MSTVLGNMLTFGEGGSEGSNEIFAAIVVSYPSRSICTATNGTTTLTASDTNGEYIFNIPEPASTPETWTISCTNGTDSDSSTISITSSGQIEKVKLNYLIIGNTLNDTTWENISKVSIAGTGDTYWDVGDCKAIILNGTVGTLALTNVTLYVYILDFNHPINKSIADNNIIWGGFKTSANNDGIDVALAGSQYGSQYTNGTKCFNSNHWGNSNYGGWKGCDFRYDILGGVSKPPSGYGSAKTTSTTGYDATAATINSPVANTLMAALPSDLRAVLRLWDRYVDFKGNSSNVDTNCSTPTIDAISLLSEYEIFGSRTYANQYEQNHQKQMAYYANGHTKIKYNHSDTSTAVYWLITSPIYNKITFCLSTPAGGIISPSSAAHSRGFAPAFRT